MKFNQPILFEEAIKRLGDRTVVASGLDSHDWSFRVPVALRDRAFFSSQVESAQFLQRSKNLLGDWMTKATEQVTRPDGSTTTALKVGSRAQFVEQARTFALAEGLGPLDPRDRGGLKDITSRKRLELIFDVQTQSAHDFGFWQQGNDPVLLDEFPAQRFVREAAVKQKRPLHEQNEGVVRLKSDLDFWIQMNSPSIGGFGVPYGPWGFNSGMGVEDVDRDEAEALGLLQPGEKIPNPETEFNDRLKASTQNLDPDVQSFLKEAFGDRVTIKDGAATWTAPSEPAAPRAPARVPVPAPEPAPTPAPARPTDSPTVTPGDGPSVGVGMLLPKRGKVRKIVEGALESIDSIHSDGTLDPIEVVPIANRGQSGSRTLGMVRRNRDGTIHSLGVNVSGPWPELSAAHEIGHVLDWVAIGEKGQWASSTADSPLAPVMKAIRESKAVARLRLLADDLSDYWAKRQVADYLLSDRELWARAYAQYVATRSKSDALKGQLTKRLTEQGPEQWTAEDFAAIATAIDAAFRSLGWIR